ncbi:DUF2252 domain-containing protein [Capillimicrobium parvum]|uniref:DUF2252 domain-containing protein n=1 Tax=Capillimicrobium parvum TaxID=2884022 RepID=A0A9E6Y280_9ACTN|nr:DUF2252 domain-containing protein [Capillimicrobium parvum]UGS38650.1 hypothetical protein DSM104329_05080 [Capillimicrobium parvum]
MTIRARTKARVAIEPVDRIAAGRAAREAAPRSSHAGWQPAPDRRSPMDLLEDEGRTRVPELLPIRYGRMLASPFTFYRGGAAIMAADLAPTPVSGLKVQACGDAHVLNFGTYAAPDRKLVFDVNDFDESLPGPWEWDVKRLAASIEIAGRARGQRRKECRGLVADTARAYREAMRTFAEMGNLDLWYTRIDEDALIRDFSPGGSGKADATLERARAKALSKSSLRAVAKLTERVDGRVRIVHEPPLIVPIAELLPADDVRDVESWMERLLKRYQRSLLGDRRHLLDGYRLVDMARKVVGVGSVGTRAWVLLLHGRDSRDPLVLQAKEAGESVLAPYVGASPFANHGQRVVEGQRLMQAASDILLGWDRVEGLDGLTRDFYVRQLWDGKFSPDIETMRPERLAVYVRLCAWTLARGHARSGDRIAISAYLGKSDVFDRAIVEFACDYADQNERDHAELVEAVRSGRVSAESGI